MADMKAGFFGRLGFTADPFEQTNADAEPLLNRYFVRPPFYTSVLGDPANPRPVAVFAPRGTGKTAQRLSMEEESRTTGRFLCVTYDKFGQVTKASLESLDADFHRRNLINRLTVGLLAMMEGDTSLVKKLNEHQRQVLLHCSREFVGKLSQQEYEDALGSVKTLKDKATEKWRQYGGAIATLIEALLKKYTLDGIKLPTEFQENLLKSDSDQYLLEQLILGAKAMGFDSVYFLIDRVDELAATTRDSAACWKLVEPLLVDLPLLETPGAGFKFFLWDQLRTSFLEGGGRPDRVKTHELDWTTDDLRTVLRRRLSAYSDDRTERFQDFFDDSVSVDAETLVVYLAAESPRDMINLCKSIIEEARRVDSGVQYISEAALLAGIRTFSRDLADLVAGSRLPDLRKIADVTFTINRLASDVFNVSENAARSKVQKWQDAGIVHKVDERPNRVNRPLHVYSIRDPRIAIAASETLDLELILDNLLWLCKACRRLQVSGDFSFRCSECDTVQAIRETDSLWALAGRTAG